MPNPRFDKRREALRGAEVRTIDLIFENLASQEWVVLLTAPLESAAYRGERDLAQKLVGAGAEIRDALHEAVEGGHGEIVTDLLESGKSVDSTSTEGRTPLHVAAVFGQTEMVKLLLLKEADNNPFDDLSRTPLYMAASRGHVGTTLALLAGGAYVNVYCGQFKIPLVHMLAEPGNIESLRAAIEHGVNVDAVDNRNEESALHVAARANNMEAVDVLVEAGANIEAWDCRGCNPLHSASGNLSRAALLCLLRHGAIVNAEDENFCNTVDAGST